MRGDVYTLRARKGAVGHEQQGPRLGVVLQADYLPLSTWIVAPTSTGRAAASFRPEVEIDGVRTRVLVEQMVALDPEVRLGEHVGTLSTAEMREIDAAIRILFDLERVPR